ncbi:hypothetical protein A4_251 [Escherichia phage A4]|nr:hypothetical protein A4_251 [Escherichia phage A4]
MLEYYLSVIYPEDRYGFNYFSMSYHCSSQRKQRKLLLNCTKLAQDEMFTYNEVLKLISI